MNCPTCSFENPDAAKFCGDCGRSLAHAAACAGCGAENPAGQKFCNECGHPLAAARVAPATDRAPRDYTPKHLADKILRSKSAVEGERKQVTVLFADVKGSMDLAAQVDPEEWHKILDRFFSILTEGVHRFEGTVNQYTGDGVMALFGAPIAHEDHAQRACYAALQIGDELRRYAGDLKRERGLQFAVRMGLNSGDVIVGRIGDDLRMDYTAQGHTVGLAQRMEQLADPGKVYASERTAKLVTGYFSLADLGSFNIKGVAEPVQVHELQGVGPLRTRLDVSRTRGLSRFVGRTEEMQILESALSHAEEGEAQVVGVVADAGVGKSRLCWEFVQRCRAKGLSVYEGHAVAHGKAVPFLPVFEYLRGYFGIGERDTERAVREKVAGKVLLLDPELGDMLPLLFDFLGVPDPERPVPRMDPEARQRRLLECLGRLTKVETRRRPGISLVEDLHWLDGGSEAFLENMVEAVAGTRSLLLVNFRPEYHARWMQKSYYQQIALSPLGPEAIAELLADLLGSDPSIDGLATLIQARTAGNAFFVEEVVQGLIEDGSLAGARGAYRLVKPIGALTVPPTVQTLLAARIDRLREREKQVLQTAAVIGKTFAELLLAAIVELPSGELGEALRALQSGEFLYQEALYPVVEYAFKHPLTQEVALGSQLQERRRRLHAAVARAIEESHPDSLDGRAALLAHHWEEAHEPLVAAQWHRRAAEWIGANDVKEAARHWNRIRELLRDAPESTEAAQLCALASTRFLGLGWRLGLTEEAAAEIYADGRRWAEQGNDADSRALLEASYAGTFTLAGDLGRAVQHSLDFERLARASDSAELRAIAASGPVYTRYQQGQLLDACRRLDELLEQTRDHPEYGIRLNGFSSYVWSLWLRGLLEVYTGAVDAGRAMHTEALRLARDRGDVELEGWIHCTTMSIAAIDGDLEGIVGHCRQSMEIAERIGSAISQHKACMQLGRALIASGEPREALALLQRSLGIARDRRTGLEDEPMLLSALAEVHLDFGELPKARGFAEQAVDLARRRGTGINEMWAQLALVRVLGRQDGAGTAATIRDALGHLETLVGETGARNMQPFGHVARATLARLEGDGATRERELREARRLFEEMGAPRRVEEIERRLASDLEP